MSTEKKEVNIEEMEGGYLVRLDFVWRDRADGEKIPRDRRVLARTLDEALSLASEHLR